MTVTDSAPAAAGDSPQSIRLPSPLPTTAAPPPLPATLSSQPDRVLIPLRNLARRTPPADMPPKKNSKKVSHTATQQHCTTDALHRHSIDRSRHRQRGDSNVCADPFTRLACDVSRHCVQAGQRSPAKGSGAGAATASVTPPKKVTPFAYEHTPAAVIAHESRLLITDSHLIFISLVIFLLFLLSYFQAADVKSGTDDDDEGADLKVHSTAHNQATAEEGDEDEVRHSHKRRPASARF